MSDILFFVSLIGGWNVERLKVTLRGQQARLTRRSPTLSRIADGCNGRCGATGTAGFAPTVR